MTMNTFYFEGKLFETFIEKENTVKLNVHAVSQSDSNLVLQENYQQRGDCCSLSIEKYGTFADSNSGLTKLFIVVKDVSSLSYYLLSRIGSNKLSAVLQFEEKNGEEMEKSLQVLDGPVLLWHCHTHIYLSSINENTKSLEKHCFSFSKKVNNFKVISAVSCDEEVYIFIRCSYQGKGDKESCSSLTSQIILWNLKLDNEGKWVKKELDPSAFLPSDYADSIKDCKVIVKHTSNKKTVVDSRIVLLLEGSYIVFLRNGVLEQCCLVKDKEYSDTTQLSEWRLVHVFYDTKCVVWTSESEVSLIDTKKEEICQTWCDVASVNVGDFLRHGSPQLLLVFQDGSAPGEIGAWHLTDFAGCQIDSRDITEPADEDESESGIASAVESLYTNLQTSMADLSVREQYFINKVKFLHNTWQQLQRNNARDPAPCGSVIPLVPMIPGRKKPKRLSNRVSAPYVGQLEAEVLWRTTVSSHLIVGVRVDNQTDRSFSKCSLLLVPHSKGNVSSGFSRWPPCLQEQMSTELGSNTGHKKLKLDPEFTKSYCRPLKPKSKVTLTVSMDLSECDFKQDVRVWVMLLAREVTPAVSETGDSGGKEGSEARILCCDLITLSSEDYLEGKYAIPPELSLFSMNNELDMEVVESSLTAVQRETRLSVTSRFTDLTGVWQVLQGGAGYTSPPGLPCLTHPSCTPLLHARIYPPSILSRTCLHLSVWTRNTNQLLLLIKHLYLHLPDDLVIRQVPSMTTSHKTALSSLGEELRTISMASRTLLEVCREPTAGTGVSLAGVKHQGDVTEYRQSFSEEQTKVQTLEDAVINTNLLKEFQIEIRRAQKKTDLIFGCLV